MNKSQRNRLEEIAGVLDGICGELDAMSYDERGKRAALSDGMQDSERGIAFERASGKLNSCADSIQGAIEIMNELIDRKGE